MSGRVRGGLACVGTCSSRRFSVGNFSAITAYCRDVFDEVMLVSGRVQRNRLNVGTCSTRSGLCGDVSGDVGLESGHFGRGRFSVGILSARSFNDGT